MKISDTKSAAGRKEGGVKPLRIMVVEDNALQLKITLGILRRMGCQVVSAGNGLEAVEVFARENLDWILMDLEMPELDGLQATMAIRDMEQGRPERSRVFIAALTASVHHGNRERARDAGMNEYLEKPFSMAAFARLMERGEPGFPQCGECAIPA